MEMPYLCDLEKGNLGCACPLFVGAIKHTVKRKVD